jgi:hypothetical protein
MVASKQATVSDRRAILTDREREIIAGDADVSESYRYQTISRVRARFGRLDDDLAALEEHGDLAREFREAVCGSESGTRERQDAVESAAEGGEGESTAPSTSGREPSPQSREDAAADPGPLEAALGELDAPQRRREATRACVEYLRESGTAQKSDFITDVYPDHPAGLQSEGGWWNAIGLELLKTVAAAHPNIHPPGGEGAHTWEYVEGRQ